MKKIGIITAMHIELAYMRSKMVNTTTVTHAGNEYICGQIGDLDVVAAVCSIGKVNAAIFTQIMIDKFAVDAIINTGIAGSLDPKAKHLSVVVSTELTYYDVRKPQMLTFFPNVATFKSDESMRKLFLEVNQDTPDVQCGMIVTGDDFISDSAKKQAIKSEYDGLCVEMESAAIAHAAHVNGVPFLIIRCISDMADDNATADYDNFETIAAEKVCKMVYKMLLSLTV